MPTIISWKQAYHDDPDTRVLFDRLSINSSLDQPTILQLPVAYRSAIARNPLGLLEGRFVYYDQVSTISNHICRIVVPLSLRRTIFTLIHATPVDGHMGKYKTLYRIKFRFFWPRLRSDIADWMKQCVHCMLTNRWRYRGQELMFSWPVSYPLAINHLDQWMPGHHTGPNGYIALMNTMCNMSQFVVVVPVPNESSDTLPSFFMQHFLMTFGLCNLVFLDNGIPFKGAFIAMCDALSLNYDVLAKRNHKGLTVEHYHRFLNKSVTIGAEDRGTNDIFVPAGIAVGYAWDSAPKDGTDILRSILAIGRELHFSIDINFSALPKRAHNSGQAALDYLKLTDSSRHFSSSILKILIEDRRTAHAERIIITVILLCWNLAISLWLKRLFIATNRRKRLLNSVMLLEDLIRSFAPQVMVVIFFANYTD